MAEKKELLTTNRKALTINLDERLYGTFAEIGAGQEVARLFFQAGGASGTIAKTISAYDMAFSDAIYGKAPRYVSRERLSLMLEHEYQLLIERLATQRGDRTAFFVFADTVATKGFKGTNDAHGWMGVRFQSEPGAAPSEVLLHVRMWDKENVQQQQALGIAGTNLLYAVFYYRDDPGRFVESLVDNLGAQRFEVDMLKFSGPAFAAADNRVMALDLVRHGLTNAVLFAPGGDMLQPSETFYKKPVLVERGAFRPVSLPHLDMLRCAAARFSQDPAVRDKDLVTLCEITMHNLLASGERDDADLLDRVDLLGDLGHVTMISNYPEYYRLTSYFRRFTKEPIGVALGITSLIEIFNEKYYEHLDGGILESFGRMFKNAVRLYAYPMRPDIRDRHRHGASTPPIPAGSELVTVRNAPIPSHLRHLYAHLVENRCIEALDDADPQALAVFSHDVLGRIRAGDPAWRDMVPPGVAATIERRRLFGCPAPAP